MFGIVILDLVDHDYSWVLQANGECIDLGTSISTKEYATELLHAAMKERSA
jgi:hypothetical protein